MSKLKQKFIFTLIAAITIAALLLPSPRLESRMAKLDSSQPQAVQTVAGVFPGGTSQDSLRQPNSYTWAG